MNFWLIKSVIIVRILFWLKFELEKIAILVLDQFWARRSCYFDFEQIQGYNPNFRNSYLKSSTFETTMYLKNLNLQKTIILKFLLITKNF